MFEARDHFHSFKGKAKKRLNFDVMWDKKRNFTAIVMDSTFLFLTLLLDDKDECELLRAPQVDIAPLALFLASFRKTFVARITNFAEEVVPLLSLDDFREHFRVTRPTFGVIVNKIHQVPFIPVVQVHGKEPIDCGKQVLLTLWYLGTQDSHLSL